MFDNILKTMPPYLKSIQTKTDTNVHYLNARSWGFVRKIGRSAVAQQGRLQLKLHGFRCFPLPRCNEYMVSWYIYLQVFLCR